ncbi:MAG: chorismate synthase [Sphingobacteriia bacterium]|nr:chorismate synthase [Sphingobacteriia bacterium]
MTGNTFGKYFKVTSFGESHGEIIGCVIDGVPPKFTINEEDIQYFLDLRKPGRNKLTSQRKEEDKVKIVSGVFKGQTTGAPLTMIIENHDKKSKDYNNLESIFRPGHADFTYFHKYGIYDYNGGGRASARETAMRVASGSVARLFLKQRGINIHAELIQIGDLKSQEFYTNQYFNYNFFTSDESITIKWLELIENTRKNCDSIGGKVRVVATGVPIGLGEPVFDKLDAEIAKAMISIPAAKAIEIGSGVNASLMKGSEHNDQLSIQNGKPNFITNNAGGILGGISNGDTIDVTVTFKPTSSIPKIQQTIDTQYNETEILVKGRHDPCVAIRAVVVVESMLALTLMDYYLRQLTYK